MALSKSVQRPLAVSTETKALSISAAVAEVNGNFHLDVTLSVTNEAEATVVKTLFRLPITITVTEATGTKPATVNIDNTIFAFNGNATTYSAGGLIPALSLGTQGVKTIDIDAFLTAAGDARD